MRTEETAAKSLSHSRATLILATCTCISTSLVVQIILYVCYSTQLAIAFLLTQTTDVAFGFRTKIEFKRLQKNISKTHSLCLWFMTFLPKQIYCTVHSIASF